MQQSNGDNVVSKNGDLSDDDLLLTTARIQRLKPSMANDFERRLRKSYTIDNAEGAFMRHHRRSLIDDARLERKLNAEYLDEIDEVNASGNHQTIGGTCVLLIEGLDDVGQKLGKIYELIQNKNGAVEHLEVRKARAASSTNRNANNNGLKSDVLVHCSSLREAGKTAEMLKVQLEARSASVFSEKSLESVEKAEQSTEATEKDPEPIWYPRHISELDNCITCISKFDPTMDKGHPGFHDQGYRKRRNAIAQIASDYKYGQPIPMVEFSQDEINTWTVVFKSLKKLYQTHACTQFMRSLAKLEAAGIYVENAVPQLENVSNFLKSQTGFQLRPVAGLLSARDFLYSLAFRVFQCTQYIRHPSSPHHSPEPDCIHELLGHVPLLADPDFAEFSQELGFAALGATDEEIEKLATLYWFSVEFGLCRDAAHNGAIRALGAGLLSSFGELEYALSGKPKLLEFEPCSVAVQEYQDQDYQPVYFVSDSFDDMKRKLRIYVKTTFSRRNVQFFFDPFTLTISEKSDKECIAGSIRAIQNQLATLAICSVGPEKACDILGVSINKQFSKK